MGRQSVTNPADNAITLKIAPAGEADEKEGHLRMRMPIIRTITVTAVAVAAVVTAPVASADGTISEIGGPLEQPFYGYLYRNGYGYLYAQKATTAAKVACAQDLAGDPLQQLVSGVQQRGFTAAEAQAIVFAMQKQNNSDAYEPLC